LGGPLHNDRPSSEPTVGRAGDTWAWTKHVPGHLSGDGWTLKYAFHNVGSASATGTKLAITASANPNGVDHDVDVAASATAALVSGNWKWVAYVESGVERYTVDQGVLFLEPNLDTAAAGTQQTHNEKMLAAIQSVLEGRATADIESYQIAGRAVNKIPVAELVKWHNIYLSRVQRERNPQQFGVMHLTTFVRP
jgi:hypothetical protein